MLLSRGNSVLMVDIVEAGGDKSVLTPALEVETAEAGGGWEDDETEVVLDEGQSRICRTLIVSTVRMRMMSVRVPLSIWHNINAKVSSFSGVNRFVFICSSI